MSCLVKPNYPGTNELEFKQQTESRVYPKSDALGESSLNRRKEIFTIQARLGQSERRDEKLSIL
jgi:hypothetical protein